MRLSQIKHTVLARIARMLKQYMPGPGDRAPIYVDPSYDYAKIENAYTVNPWIHACVDVRAKKLAELPLKLYKEVGRGEDVERQEVFDHPLVELFWRPNRMQSQFEFIRDAGAELSLTGETFIFAENGSQGKRTMGTVKSLHLLHPRFIKQVIAPSLGMVTGYEYDQGGQPHVFAPEFITHAKTYNPETDLRGLPPLHPSRLAYYMQQYMAAYNVAFFQNGGSPKMALVSKGRVSDDAKTRNSEQFAKNFLGYANNGKIPHFDSDTMLQMVSVTARDGEFIALHDMTCEQVLAVMMTPPVMVGRLKDASYANAREQTRIFYELAIGPMACLLESAINRQIIDVWFPDKGLYCEFDMTGIESLQADRLRIAQIDHIYLSDGKVTINELRERDNEDSVSWGDKPYSPLAAAFGVGGNGGGGDDVPPPAKSRVGPLQVRSLRKSEEGRAELWRQLTAPVAAFENQFDRSMHTFFGQQVGRIESKIKEVYGVTLAIGYQERQTITPGDLGLIFDANSEDELIRQFVAPIYKSIIQSAGQIGLDAVSSDAVFNVADPRVAELIGRKLGLIARINNTTREFLGNLLTSAALENQTVEETARAIRRMFDDFTPARATMIARTETIGAHNGAMIEGYRQAGVVQKKEWLSSRDADVRESHIAMDGIAVELNQLFPNGVDYPGGNGPADETINCRCTTLAVLEE